MALLTPEEKKQVEARIAVAESRTSGELVVSIVRASGDYSWVRWAGALIGWAIVSVILVIDSFGAGWGLSTLAAMTWQALGAVAGSGLARWPALARRTISRKTLAAHVHHECLAHFTALGIHETRDRTGILIFISEFERRVEIVADTGIHEQAGSDYWREQIEAIAQGLRVGKAASAISQAVDRIGDKLAVHYPPHPDQKGELSNEVRDNNQIRD